MNTLQSADHQNEPLQQKILLDWLSTAFQTLENEGLSLVDGYWRDLKLEGKNQPYYPKVTLGLRIRRRQGGSFSLEWFGIGTLGTKRRYIAKRYIPKGKAEAYPIKRLMRGQPHWLMPLVEDTEYHLAKIRNRHVQLSKIREALASWYSHELERPIKGREMLDEYRMLVGLSEVAADASTPSPIDKPPHHPSSLWRDSGTQAVSSFRGHA